MTPEHSEQSKSRNKIPKVCIVILHNRNNEGFAGMDKNNNDQKILTRPVRE